MFRAPICPSSGVQIVTSAFGDQPWKAAWNVYRWAAGCVHCSEDVVPSSPALLDPGGFPGLVTKCGSHYLYSWWWACWCPKHVEPINFIYCRIWLVLYLSQYLRCTVTWTSRIPSAVCEAPPEDQQIMLETCRGPYILINWIKCASSWFRHTDVLWCTVSKILNLWIY
jgi:hypothetical protein